MNLAKSMCDACGTARVYATHIVSMPSGNYLTLCRSHERLHHDALVGQGAYIVEADEIVV
jgi:hypothetical protein